MPSRNGRAKDVELVEYDRFIDKQIHRTRQNVKLVDLAYAGLQLLVGVAVALLAATLIEHWLVPGGFNQPIRFLLFGLLLGSAGYFFARRLLPLLRGRINPVYAAHTIEHGHPTLKNSLVNFLLFRTRREQMPAAVYEALEQQAAQGLARVPADLTIDRTPLIRWGYVLVAVVVLAALYAAFSPKHPFATAGRVLAPWAAIAPPSRVNVERVEPGTTTITQGETLTVSAEVRGLRDDETVELRYTTADRQEVDAAVAMRPSETGLRYEATLPPVTAKSLGVDGDLMYRIEAGDARTIDYQVSVVTAPTIVVRQVQYEYPDYTGYLDQRIDNLGDIRGIEGTRVTIHAEANGLIDTAELDFNADGRSDLRMEPEGTKATVSFVLALRDDRRTPQHTGYTLRFKNQDGHTNLRPAQYKIDVIPDYAPEVELIAPEERVRDVRLHETIVVAVDARDPDFNLTDVSLVGQSTGRKVLEEPMLAAKDRHEGRFTGEYRFTPEEHDLKPGDEVQYWATARDNRQLEANVTASSHKTFRIVDPDPQQPDPNALAQRDSPRDPKQQPGQEGAGEGQPQPDNQGGQQGGKAAGQPGDAAGGQPEQGQEGEGAEGNQAGGEGESNNGEPAGDEPFGREADRGGQAESAEPSAQPGEQGQGQPGEPQQNGQPGEGQQDAQPGEPTGDPQQSPVARDGSDDGTAFERIAEHLNKDNQNGESGQRREGGEGPGDSTAKPPSGEPSAQQQPQDNQPGAETEGQSKPSEQQRPVENADDGQRRGEEQPAGRPDQERPDASEGTGAKTQAGSPDAKDSQQQAQDGETKSSGGEQQRPRGEPGQGGQEKPQGVPDGDQPLQHRQKTPGDPNEKPRDDDQEPPGASESKKESDSRGEEGGDQAGGGQEGGGQKAPREGTGSPGQNQAADEGAGRSADQGPGEDTTQPGSDAQSQQPTGEQGEQSAGEGTGRRDGTGEQPGGEQGTESPPSGSAKPPSGEPFSREEESSEPDVQSGEQSQQPQGEGAQQPGEQGGAVGNPTTGGNTGSDSPAVSSPGRNEPGDEANLEYARRQTELTLEKLSDQLRRQDVDQEMLDKLGWSEEDLQRFVERWRERMAAAQRSDEQGQAAKQELDQALRQLGPRRPESLQSATERQQDNVRDLRDAPRTPVPLEWQEWMRAYNQGVSRNKQNGRGKR